MVPCGHRIGGHPSLPRLPLSARWRAEHPTFLACVRAVQCHFLEIIGVLDDFPGCDRAAFKFTHRIPELDAGIAGDIPVIPAQITLVEGGQGILVGVSEEGGCA